MEKQTKISEYQAKLTEKQTDVSGRMLALEESELYVYIKKVGEQYAIQAHVSGKKPIIISGIDIATDPTCNKQRLPIYHFCNIIIKGGKTITLWSANSETDYHENGHLRPKSDSDTYVRDTEPQYTRTSDIGIPQIKGNCNESPYPHLKLGSNDTIKNQYISILYTTNHKLPMNRTDTIIKYTISMENVLFENRKPKIIYTAEAIYDSSRVELVRNELPKINKKVPILLPLESPK